MTMVNWRVRLEQVDEYLYGAHPTGPYEPEARAGVSVDISRICYPE